ncbi:MAG TPA: TPM domain-containing protein, partial [Polyangiaceae bacterium]|nr:TPM domain-containing protein [Polyangiaceae bacterium]
GRERALFSLGLTLCVALALYRFVPWLPEAWLLCIELPLAVCFWWLAGTSSVLRRIVPARVQLAAVGARAQQAFIEQGVTETRQRSGVLLFLSEAERRVELLADRGIHLHVGAESWQRLVNRVVADIRAGRAAQGVAAAIDSIGESLARHFPPEPDDINELADAPRHI